MESIFHLSESRGSVDFGWLKSNHTFSFGEYHNPERMAFGVLRVLNDDIVSPSKGFATHAHKNMEIISIALSGSLEHKDSFGNETIIEQNDVQIMSAGTGVAHSEYNHSSEEDVNLLQIWILPEQLDIKPRYDQKTFFPKNRLNKLQNVVAPIGSKKSGIKINQQAYFFLSEISKGQNLDYSLVKKENGLYLFLIEGAIVVGNHTLAARDGLGIRHFENLKVSATANSKVLFMEVPF